MAKRVPPTPDTTLADASTRTACWPDQIRAELREGAQLREWLAEQRADAIASIARELVRCYAAGGCVFLCGNGGSAGDSQHLAAELVGRFRRDRRPLAAVALTTDSSALTAIGNDYGFEHIFARQVEALVRPGDVLIALSTSGRSPNVLAAVAAARGRGAFTVGLCGGAGGPLAAAADLAIEVPSRDTARIQECHLAIGHIVCNLVECWLLEHDAPHA